MDYENIIAIAKTFHVTLNGEDTPLVEYLDLEKLVKMTQQEWNVTFTILDSDVIERMCAFTLVKYSMKVFLQSKF